jgi:antitoxin component of RelBE/YafQ-DinJ toxin-antitoxin module
MTFSTGINIYVKTVGRRQKIPFELTVNEHAHITAIPGKKISQEEKKRSRKEKLRLAT